MKTKDEIIKDLKKQLRETKIGEGILLGLIWNDAWDLSGEKEYVKDSLGITSREYNYLKRKLHPSYFGESIDKTGREE